MVALLREHAEDVHEYSVDESFVLWPATTAHAQALEVQRAKTLAKIGSHLAKHSASGIADLALCTQEQIDAVLAALPVNQVWGIGSRLPDKLAPLGIQTAKDLKAAIGTYRGPSSRWAARRCLASNSFASQKTPRPARTPAVSDSKIVPNRTDGLKATSKKAHVAPAENAVIAAASIPSAIAATYSHAVFQEERGEGGAISPFPLSQVCFTVKFPFVR